MAPFCDAWHAGPFDPVSSFFTFSCKQRLTISGTIQFKTTILQRALKLRRDPRPAPREVRRAVPTRSRARAARRLDPPGAQAPFPNLGNWRELEKSLLAVEREPLGLECLVYFT